MQETQHQAGEVKQTDEEIGASLSVQFMNYSLEL